MDVGGKVGVWPWHWQENRHQPSKAAWTEGSCPELYLFTQSETEKQFSSDWRTCQGLVPGAKLMLFAAAFIS